MRSTFFAIGLAGAAIAAPQPLQRRQAASLASSVVSSAASTPAVASSSASAVSSSAASSSASASASASPAASNVTASFLAAVRARDADAFASLLEGQPALVQQIVSLAGTPYTVILPGSLDNVAIDTSNSTLVAELVQYHILPGNYSVASLPVNQTNIVPTALTNYQGTQGAQVLVFTKDVYGTTVIGGASNATILANSNFLFKLANRALTLPTNISATVESQPETTVLGGALANFPQLVQQADSASAITVFAPENSVLEESLARLGAGGLTAASNSTIIGNHIITGQTLYSTNLTSAQNVQNANGGAVTFTANSTGAFVTSGGNTAKIIRADINAINGVVHIIDAPLFAANASTASSGSSSASSAASSATAIASSAVSSASAAPSSVASA